MSYVTQVTAYSYLRLTELSHSRDPTALHRAVGFWRYCTQDAQQKTLINAEIPHVVPSMSSENLKFQLLDDIEAIFMGWTGSVRQACSVVALGTNAATYIWTNVIPQV